MSDFISREAVLNILDDMTKDYAKSKDFEKVNGVAWVKVQKLPSVNPQEPKTDVLDNILREIEIEETLSDDKPNTAWAIGYKQGLQTVRRIVERYKAESEDKG